MEHLHAALGHPGAYLEVPPRRSFEWEECLRRLSAFAGLEFEYLRGRGPVWLWERLHGRNAPVDIRWGALLEGWRDSQPDQIREALRRGGPLADLQVWSWNTRWLVSTRNDRADAKKRCIEDALRRGAVVCIQEAHWTSREGSCGP